MLQCKEIIKIFKGPDPKIPIAPLQGLELELKDNEIISIFGPSGSGKSTLLNILYGVYSVDSGIIMFNGEIIGNINKKIDPKSPNTLFSYFIQDFRKILFPKITVKENLHLKCDILKINSNLINEKINKVLTQVNLIGKINHKVENLSIGEQQRLALALTIINEPALLLVDEPTSNLDSVTANKIINHLISIVRENPKISCIITTHDMKIANLTDRSVSLEKGRLVPMNQK